MGLLDYGHAAEPPSASAILQELREFRECGSVLYIAAHPDDENTQFIAYMAKERAMRVGYLSLTRGEGGQDLIGPEIGDPLGVIRTQELLAARRIDGGQQFFTRAKDFGFSKDYEQTLAKWDRQAVLSDVVRVIRQFRPDVIVTRFPLEGGGTHGHHTASTVLALEAFKLAGDPKAFPGQVDGWGPLKPWQPKRIYWNSFRGGSEPPPLRLDIGGYLPVLGKSVGEIAALSRSSHRSQGYGSIASRGSRLDEFRPLDGQPIGKDLFDGIDTTWSRLPGGKLVDSSIGDVITNFNPLNPSASVSALIAIDGILDRWPDDPLTLAKRRQLHALIIGCVGLYTETTVAEAEVVPGETLTLHHTAVVRSDFPVQWQPVTYLEKIPGKRETSAVVLRENQPSIREATFTLPIDTPPSQPYWLRVAGTPGMYRVDDQALIGESANVSPLNVLQTFLIGGRPIQYFEEAVQVKADPSKGEIRTSLSVIPSVALTMSRDVVFFAPGAEQTVTVEIKAYRDHQNGTVKLDAPDGWKVSAVSQPFQLAAIGDHQRFEFTVTAPPQPTTATLTAQAIIDGKIYSTSRQEIRYEHIPPQLLQPPARIKAVCLDLAIRGKRIGYLPGAGDRVAESIAAMGYEVTPLTGADLTTNRLQDFDAVVIGVRAFNVRTDLLPGLNALFAYAENGGNVVIQYNTPNDLKTTKLAPFDLELSRDLPHNRVTNENAPVTLLAPAHPAFNTPNKIGPADFDGWVQERGLNFPSTWDTEHFTALLACSDPGEAPLKSGLLVADYGKGHVVYTGLSFFRQLPAGVPGAYRLFANLISLGK